MARDRYDDDDDERPRSSRRRDDDDDDRPRSSRRRDDDDDDDYDDRPRRSGGGMGPLDGMYRDTNVVVLVLFGLCCGLIAFVLSLVAYLTGKDPKAKSNAMLVMIVGGVSMVVGIVIQLAGVLGGAAGR